MEQWPQKAQKGSKAKQGVKKRLQYGWNCGAARNHSVGRRIHLFSFCVSVPFVVIAFDGIMATKSTKKDQKPKTVSRNACSTDGTVALLVTIQWVAEFNSFHFVFLCPLW